MKERKSYIDLRTMASRLKLTFARDHLEEILRQAEETKMSPFELLQVFLSKECAQRNANRYRQAMQVAHFPYVRTSRCLVLPVSAKRT